MLTLIVENVMETMELGRTDDRSFNAVNKERQDYKNRNYNGKIQFMICNSCYWCASYFEISDLESQTTFTPRVNNCHVCNSNNTEPLMNLSR
jgi:hypothetical protein